MESYRFNEKNEGLGKHHITLILFLIFVGIIGFIIYSSMHPDFSKNLSTTITGDTIKSTEKSIFIDTLMIPPESLNIESAGKIKIKAIDPHSLNLNSQKFDLSDKSRASIVIENFNGNLILNKREITSLDGTANKIFIEGIPVLSKSNMRISLDESIQHSYLKLENTNIKSLSYSTSGKISLNHGKVIVNLENEEIDIKNFKGDLELRDKIKLTGDVGKSNLLGFLELTPNSKRTSKQEGETKE